MVVPRGFDKVRVMRILWVSPFSSLMKLLDEVDQAISALVWARHRRASASAKYINTRCRGYFVPRSREHYRSVQPPKRIETASCSVYITQGDSGWKQPRPPHFRQVTYEEPGRSIWSTHRWWHSACLSCRNRPSLTTRTGQALLKGPLRRTNGKRVASTTLLNPFIIVRGGLPQAMCQGAITI